GRRQQSALEDGGDQMTVFRAPCTVNRNTIARRLQWLMVLLFSVHGPRVTEHAAWAFGKNQVGTSGAAFLKIGPGARPAAMGEAFTGVADDIHAIYWNPAGLATLRSPELTGMHME